MGAVAARAVVTDFNGGGYPDYLLYNAGTRLTAIWYFNKSVKGVALPSSCQWDPQQPLRISRSW